MKSEEIRFVSRQETFNDFAVRELAKGRAACICKIQGGRCKKTECCNCPIGKQYWRCYSNLSDYDKQRLAGYVSDEYVELSRHIEQFMPYKKFVAYEMKYIFGAFVFLLFMVLFALFMVCMC